MSAPEANSPLATNSDVSNNNNTASGIPFIKSRGRTVPKPFNLSSSSKKRDISQVSNSSEGKKSVDQSKKLKPTLSKTTNSGVPFIKKKEATVCEPPKFLTTAKREPIKKQPVQKNPEKTPFSVEEDLVESLIREIHAQNFKKDVNADIEKVKVSVDVLIARLNSKLDELKNTYLFNVQSVDISVLKNFCRHHSRKFEIAQDKEKNQKIVRLKKPSVLKTVNTIINKPLKPVLIASIKSVQAISTPIQETVQISEQKEPESIEISEQQMIVQETTEQSEQLPHIPEETVQNSEQQETPQTFTEPEVGVTTTETIPKESANEITEGSIQGQN